VRGVGDTSYYDPPWGRSYDPGTMDDNQKNMPLNNHRGYFLTFLLWKTSNINRRENSTAEHSYHQPAPVISNF
jgi:hypothetical protein